MDAAGKCGDGLGGGVHVGGFGVVVELDAIHGGDVFQAMLDGAEVLYGAAHGGAGAAGEARGANRGEDIFHVVRALEGDAAKGMMGSGGADLRVAEEDFAVLNPCALKTGCSMENQ